MVKHSIDVDAALRQLVDDVHAGAPVPTDALTARVLSDAAAQAPSLPAGSAPAAPRPPIGRWIAEQLLDWGGAAAATLLLCLCLGFGFGYELVETPEWSSDRGAELTLADAGDALGDTFFAEDPF